MVQVTEPDVAQAGIPRIIHQIWFGGPMPPEFVRYGRELQALHPGWIFHYWGSGTGIPYGTSAAVRRLLDLAPGYFPHDALRFRADVLRLEVLRLHGGVYVDTDVEALRPLDGLLAMACGETQTAFAGYSPSRGPGGERLLTNAIMGATPRHPWIKRCLDELPESLRARRGKPLAQVAGPWHVTRCWHAEPAGVAVLEPPVLYPRTDEEREGAFTVHHWATGRDRRRRERAK